MVKARRYAIVCANTKFGGTIWLDLPGTREGRYSTREAFEQMVSQPYFERATLLPALLQHAQSRWEIVDLYELMFIGDNVAGDARRDLPQNDTETFRMSLNHSLGLANDERLTVAGLAAFGAFTLHYHAEAISKLVLPQLSLPDAVYLAESLVLAESFVLRFSDVGSSIDTEELTALERQVCELSARLWQEWPEGKDFGMLLREHKPTYAEQRLRNTLAPAGEVVAA